MQERLTVQNVSLKDKETSLKECERWMTRLEAKTAVQQHQHQSAAARLEESNSHLAAEVHQFSSLFLSSVTPKMPICNMGLLPRPFPKKFNEGTM